ncbi:hypothetical protein [Cohnella caldifontis]|uniref:hypothetical protein n=1 Tax=Cohnella caldifontis TaxID=3027471 RepID=UPI0023EA87D0|nr:hypothetical protein [Cohnella sp. YIM B05605]
MSLMDALFYWLQMKLVSDSRPDDEAARDTAAFFAQILSEDHELTSFEVVKAEDAKIHVAYRKADGTGRTVWFDREAAEQLFRTPVLSREEKALKEQES